jgi:hypothetical protein
LGVLGFVGLVLAKTREVGSSGSRLAFAAARVSRAWCRGWLCPIGTAVGRWAGVEIVAASARERNSDSPARGRLLLLPRSGSRIEPTGYRFDRIARNSESTMCPSLARSREAQGLDESFPATREPVGALTLF